MSEHTIVGMIDRVTGRPATVFTPPEDCISAPICGAQYGRNPDLCTQAAGHSEKVHSNRWGTTWPVEATDAPATWERGSWMQTYTGRKFYPMAPHPDDIDPTDIAHALSLTCRYNGHVDRFYSVAEHCVLMASVMPTPELRLWALLHDAAEAYVGDMVRPLKQHMPAYRAVEDRLLDMIVTKWGLEPGMPAEVKDADNRILLSERATLMSAKAPEAWGQDGLEPLPVVVRGLPPEEAEYEYIAALADLAAEELA